MHRADAIPATFFCRGRAIDQREQQFSWFRDEVAGDPLDNGKLAIGLQLLDVPKDGPGKDADDRSLADREPIDCDPARP